MSAMDEEIAAYAAAVRAALADVPEPDREELLADLEEHLTEVAAESSPSAGPQAPGGQDGQDGQGGQDVPGGPVTSADPRDRLVSRLGTPETYAAELRAAYGVDSPRTRKRALGGLTLSLSPSAQVWLHRGLTLAAEFRSTWWLLRGYLLTLVVWNIGHGTWTASPWTLVDLLILIGLVGGSVALGLRVRDRSEPLGRGGRRALKLGNGVLAAMVLLLPLFAGITLAVPFSGGAAPAATMEGYPSDSMNPGFGDAVNIYPYARDGKPLDGVLLYDQNGKPITLPYQDHGLELDQPCGGPPAIANAYPLRLREQTFDGDGESEAQAALGPAASRPSCAPATATPSPAPRPSGTATPAPAPAGSPATTPTTAPTPTASPSP